MGEHSIEYCLIMNEFQLAVCEQLGSLSLPETIGKCLFLYALDKVGVTSLSALHEGMLKKHGIKPEGS